MLEKKSIMSQSNKAKKSINSNKKKPTNKSRRNNYEIRRSKQNRSKL